tara:strand:- start:644 stop:967 length:324 start_codon:yes stop_codon:yes gene_type:complete
MTLSERHGRELNPALHFRSRPHNRRVPTEQRASPVGRLGGLMLLGRRCGHLLILLASPDGMPCELVPKNVALNSAVDELFKVFDGHVFRRTFLHVSQVVGACTPTGQ